MQVLNEECLRLALRAAMILGCTIRPSFTFDRKHYTYPDLPHGYQITQYYGTMSSAGRRLISIRAVCNRWVIEHRKNGDGSSN